MVLPYEVILRDKLLNKLNTKGIAEY